MAFILLLGGARSGKSALALEIARRSGADVALVATAESLDDEMAERIARHRAQRPTSWTTVEESVALAQAVRAVPEHQLLVIDCLTLWVSNLMGRNLADEAIAVAAEETAGLLGSRPGGAVVVSNEVGLGIIPDNPLGRRYRDALGRVNATFAAQAQRTVFVVAGRLHELTRAADFIERMAWPAR